MVPTKEDEKPTKPKRTLPPGVHAVGNKFIGKVTDGHGNRVYTGSFATVGEAEESVVKAKAEAKATKAKVKSELWTPSDIK